MENMGTTSFKVRLLCHVVCMISASVRSHSSSRFPGADPGGAPPVTTKNEAPAPKFYKTEAPEWQF